MNFKVEHQGYKLVASRAALRCYPHLFEKTDVLSEVWLDEFVLAYSRLLITAVVNLVFDEPILKTALENASSKDIIIDDAIHAQSDIRWRSEIIFSFAHSMMLKESIADFALIDDLFVKIYSAETVLFKSETLVAANTTYSEEQLKQGYSKPLFPDETLGDYVFAFPPVFDGRVLTRDPNELKGSMWYFWERWFMGFFRGKPLDWDLQREVALISDADWELGAEHIAGLVEPICSRYEAKARAIEARAALVKQIEALPAGLGHNGPPAELAITGPTRGDVTQIIHRLEHLENRLASPTPDKVEIQKDYEWLKGRLTVFVDTSLKIAATGLTTLALTKLTTIIDALKPVIDALLKLLGG